MKALVVIFALLGILGSIGVGAIFTSVVQDDDGKKDSIAAQMKSMDEMVSMAKSSDLFTDEQRKDLVAGTEELKSALEGLRHVSTPLYVSGGLGLLMMILALANVGPKAVSGAGFLLAGIAPGAWTYFAIARPMTHAEAALGGFQKKLGMAADVGASAAEAVGPLLLFVSAASAAFLVAGLFAFLVKRTPKAPVQAPLAAPIA